MLKTKIITAQLLALSMGTALAGTMGPVCTPGNATVPCPATGWDFGIQALYLKPSYNAIGTYVGFQQTGDTLAYNEFKPVWGWGFRLEGSYHFSTGNDINLNWLYYKKRSTQTFTITPLQPFFGNMYLSDDPRLNIVNLEFAQHVDFGEFKDIRFHAGVQYLDYHHVGIYTDDVNQYFTATLTTRGFGPRVGADYTYNFGNGLGVYAKGASALLVGKSDMAGDVYAVSAAYGSKKSMVPELEAKLGVVYNYAMGSGTLTLDAGWLWINYFNMEHWYNGEGIVETDLALTGPYIGLKWVGNI